jgi:RHS repeat-associated protein
MKRVMSRIAHLVLIVLTEVVFTSAASASSGPPLERPEKGHGRYVLVLWEPGTPIPGSNPPQYLKKVPEPDIEKLGGKVLRHDGHRRLIHLPVGAAKELRQHASVIYLQRLWMGEPLEELREDASMPNARFDVGSESDTSLSWGPRTYTYDGSGNIKEIGTDNYTYDSAGRLIAATVGGRSESFKYDEFGNLLEKSVAGSTPVAIPVDASSNRMVNATYDAAGNVTSRHGVEGAYRYDAFNMMTGYDDRRLMVYDAHDERLAVIIDRGLSRWTVRDFQGRAIREFKGVPEYNEQHWVWEQDYVYGDSQLIGGERLKWQSTHANGGQTVYGGVRHYHLDHLGSVRLVTTASKKSVSEHEYLPFGVAPTKTYQEEINWGDPHIDSVRWAGHQRDFLGHLNAENSNYLDYMHARYYDPNLGRFLSVDPVRGHPANPQSWNRYAYVMNQPVNFLDANGKYRTDFHRDLTHVLALAAGYSPNEARAIAAATELPDLDERKPTSPLSYSARRNFHFTSADRLQDLELQAWESRSAYDIGSYLHAFQDSYSHRGFGPGVGHISPALRRAASGLATGGLIGAVVGGIVGAHASWDVDTTAARPDIAWEAARDTYNFLVSIRGAEGAVSFNAISTAVSGYLAAEEHSAARTYHYNILCRQVGCGGDR